MKTKRTVFIEDDSWARLVARAKRDDRSVSYILSAYGMTLGDEVSPAFGKSRRITAKNIDEKNDGFEDFWGAYPRRIAKPSAKRAWRQLNEGQKQKALAVLHAFRFPADPKFIPYPATWLNQRRFEDEDIEAMPPVPKGPAPADWETAPKEILALRDKAARREVLSEIEADSLNDFITSFL